MSSSPMSDQAPSCQCTPQETPMRRPTAPVLGTPWTSSATKVALLGAGEIGKEVAIALTRLGVSRRSTAMRGLRPSRWRTTP